MSKVYKFVPEKQGEVIFLAQDSDLRAIEDLIAKLELKDTDFNVIEVLYLAEDISVKVMQTTEKDPNIRAWYYMSEVAPEDPDYVKAQQHALEQ